ncbi:dynamin family protein [Bacillus anthracis]|uniref:dynamin family protein n=1 Tax=Bacillus anthracis TaxID=1392 RepID=UPI002DBBDB5D|nr:dynamin family protein [Bacillus anthracis]MEB9506489.1 dynamin family protein [Bacillus anthracis]
MTKIVLKYNPYKIETVVTIDGELITGDSYLAQYRNMRLQLWIDKLIEKLVEESNEDTFSLTFEGTTFDFEDVEEVCGTYNHEHNANITVNYTRAENDGDKIDELKSVFEYMQEGPLEELKSSVLRKKFDKALNSEFEIAVVATMSSGKSTLINALLGMELMPAKNEACTATIATIKNTVQNNQVLGRCLNYEQEEVEGWRELNLEMMESFNDNEEVSNIEIKVNIPNISSGKMDLVLVDTPGPNNSRNSSHQNYTYRFIKNDTKPMVLYILNATQLGIQDDNDLLDIIAEQMKIGGKQSQDRFIFVVNKIDEFDIESGESVRETILTVREYLEEKGIKNPNIFPASALMAKLIRMDQNGYHLTKKQKKTLRDHDLFIEEEELNLMKYAPLSKKSKESLNTKVIEAREVEDTYQEVLMYSGIPSIEEAINGYLEKYAVPSKITIAVNSFKDVITDTGIEKNITDEIVCHEQKYEEIREKIKILNEEIARERLKKDTQLCKLDYRDAIKQIEDKIKLKFDDMCVYFQGEESVTEEVAIEFISRLKEEIELLQNDIKVELKSVVKKTLTNDVQGLYSEEEFQISFSDISDVELIMEEGMSNNHTKETGNIFYVLKLNSILEFIGVDIRKSSSSAKKFVNVKDINEKIIDSVKHDLYNGVWNTIDYLQKKEKILTVYFNKEVDRLENVLDQKVKAIEKLSADSEEIKKKLTVEKEKYEWLQTLQIRLNNILEI